MARPTVVFGARLMPPHGGGIERFSADVLAAVRQDHPIIDLANRRHRRSQFAYLAGLRRRIRGALRRVEGLGVVDGGDASLSHAVAGHRAPSIVRVHGLDLLAPNPVYQAYVRRYLPRVDLVVANSRPTARLVQGLGIPQERIRVVHPGAILDGPWTPEPEAGRVLLVGRLVERKAVAEFIRDIWPEVARRVPGARLDIVGHGPEQAAVERAVAEEGRRSAIRLHGYLPLDQLNELYRRASVFAMNNRSRPGDFEGFGIVAAEAALRGLPVVARAVDGVVDAVVHGMTGRLVGERDDDGMVDAVVECLQGGAPEPRAIQQEAQVRWGSARLRLQYARVIDDALALAS